MFKKSNKNKDQEISFIADGKKFDISATDLALSNNLLLKALISELVRKKIINQAELSETLKALEKEYIRQK